MFTAELFPGMELNLRLRPLWSSEFYICIKRHEKKKSDFWLILKDSVHEQWHGCVCGI